MIRMDIVNQIIKYLKTEEEGGEFIPYENYLNSCIVPEEARELEEPMVTIAPNSSIQIKLLSPSDLNVKVIAVDTTSSRLGEVEDGVVGAIRGTIIERNEHNVKRIYRYGPFIFKVTTRNAYKFYNDIRHIVLNTRKDVASPSPYKLVDRARSFLEKAILYYIADHYRNTIILLDGSLITGTVDTPNVYMEDFLSTAKANNNDIVAISKRTSLILSSTKRSILSVLDDEPRPSCASVKQFIEQDKSRYLGEIYVCRYFYGSHPFRTDIPYNTHYPHELLLGYVQTLCGPMGYPEELREAHIYSIFTSLEYLELQSIAVNLYKMKIKENIRKRLFGVYR